MTKPIPPSKDNQADLLNELAGLNPDRPFNATEEKLRAKGVIYDYALYGFKTVRDSNGIAEVIGHLGKGDEGARRAAEYAGIPVDDVLAFLQFAYRYELD